jgi:hypothetical protein
VGQVFRELSQYANFQGIRACWSANKSLSLYLIFESWLVADRLKLDRHAMRPGIVAHWGILV